MQNPVFPTSVYLQPNFSSECEMYNNHGVRQGIQHSAGVSFSQYPACLTGLQSVANDKSIALNLY